MEKQASATECMSIVLQRFITTKDITRLFGCSTETARKLRNKALAKSKERKPTPTQKAILTTDLLNSMQLTVDEYVEAAKKENAALGRR